MSQAVQTGYELLNKIGGGGFGEVYRAHQPSLSRFVAIKAIRAELAADPEFSTRFFAEARMSAQLSHPNIVHIYEVGEHAGRPYIVMELLQGESLEDTLKRGPLGEAEVIRIARQVLAGLSHAHSRSVIAHRDIKPSNIFLHSDAETEEEPVVKVLDFGIAKAAQGPASPHTRVGTVFGTSAYMSPEQSDGLPVDARSDLYSLGVVLYEMLTGAAPFQADSDQALARLHRTAPPPPLPGSVSAGLRYVVERALAKDPAQRFGSAREMLTALDGRPAVSGNCAVSGDPEAVPEGALRGWNWGAFSFGWVWLFAHKAWFAALAFLIIPNVLFFVLNLNSHSTSSPPSSFKDLYPPHMIICWLIQLGVVVYLGLQGNRLAWRSGRFRTLAEMKACENVWTKWGIGLFILNLLCLGFVAYSQVETSKKAVNKRPSFNERGFNLTNEAYDLMGSNKLPEAVAKAREAVTAYDGATSDYEIRDSGDAHAILSIALLEQNWGQGIITPEAQQEAIKAEKLKPLSALAHAAAGDIDIQIKDYPLALSELQLASNLEYTGRYGGYIHNQLAVIYADQNDLTNSKIESNKSIDADKKHFWWLLSIIRKR